MKKSLWIARAAILVSSSAFAYLPASDVTTMALPVYGIYTTSDATCTTGLTATVALTATPQTINFAASPVIGSGSLPSTIGCVIVVIGNSLSNAWASGTYTTTSTNGGSNTYNDSNCNLGGSTTGQTICHSGQTITWPTQITTDAKSVGLTLATTTCAGTTTEVIPLVLSTNSVCTGQTAVDSTVAACQNVNMDNFNLPTSTSDPSNGTKLTAPSTAGNLKFVVNPANTLGGESGGTCGNISAPLFSFAAD